MLTQKELELIHGLKWSKERITLDLSTEVITKSVKVPFRHRFWKIWKANKLEMKQLGYSVIKPDLSFYLVHTAYKPRETRSWTDNEPKTNK